MNKSASDILATALLLTIAAAPAGAREQVATGRVTVVDGDTLDLRGLRIRLESIDVPEARQTCREGERKWPCGRRAAFALADMVGARPVTCRWRGRDRYRRPVARCAVAGVDLGGWMVERGWALAYRRYGVAYVPHEERARAARRGLWSGWFVPPWALRRGNGGEVSAGSYAGT